MQTDASEVFKKPIKETNDSFRNQLTRSSNKLTSRHSPTKSKVFIVENLTFPILNKTNATLNSRLSTVKPVSSSLKTKETLKRVSKVSRNEVPIQAKKLKLDDKIESAQKGVETEVHVREGLSPQFLDKLLLRRKVLISASTTKTIGVQNASA